MSEGGHKIIPPSPIRGEGGMTLVELILVVALMLFIIAISVKSIHMMGQSSDTGKLGSDINRICYGISEYQLTTKTIPAASSWPATLNDFIDSSLQSSYAYACTLATNNVVTITTTRQYTFDPTQRLIDQNVCTNDGNSRWNTDNTVTCRPVIFSAQACTN